MIHKSQDQKFAMLLIISRIQRKPCPISVGLSKEAQIWSIGQGLLFTLIALVARLLEGTGVNANNGIISGVLVTVGDLARVGGFAMREYIPELMPLTVEALLDGAAVTKREVAVATLRQVVQSTGYRLLNHIIIKAKGDKEKE
ncbi:hypothetical protein SCA6_003990 [Theobroma cacao]